VKVFLVSLILLVLVTTLFFNVSSQAEITAVVYIPVPIDREADPPSWDFEVMDISTGDIIFEASSEEHECPSRLSPNGQFLLYGIGGWPEDFDYRILDLRTGEEISESFSNPSYLHWLPDSSGFVFAGRDEEAHHIYHYNQSDRRMSILQTLDWSPRIAFAGNRMVYIQRDLERDLVSIYQLDGQSALFKLPDISGIYNFSDDGRFLQYIAAKSYDHKKIFLLDTSNGEIREIEDAFANFFPSWRPNSNQLIYHDTGSNLVLYNVFTDEKILFPSGSGWVESQSAFWSSDGQYVVIDTKTGIISHGPENTLGVLEIETGEYQSVDYYNADYNPSGFLRWINNHQFVYLYTNLGGVPSADEYYSDIFLYDVTTQTKTNLTNTPLIQELTSCAFG
jgi:Tol biopolymer transport system component